MNFASLSAVGQVHTHRERERERKPQRVRES